MYWKSPSIEPFSSTVKWQFPIVLISIRSWVFATLNDVPKELESGWSVSSTYKLLNMTNEIFWIFRCFVKVNNSRAFRLKQKPFYVPQNPRNKHETLWLRKVKCELVVDREHLRFVKSSWSVITNSSHSEIEASIVLSFERSCGHNWWTTHWNNRPRRFSCALTTAFTFFMVGVIATVWCWRLWSPRRRCWFMCCWSCKWKLM